MIPAWSPKTKPVIIAAGHFLLRQRRSRITVALAGACNHGSLGRSSPRRTRLAVEAVDAPGRRGAMADEAQEASRRGRRGGGQDREVVVSKALSRLLRHQAGNAGIALDDEGFAPLDKVLQWGPLAGLKVSLEEVLSVVESNAKQRFALRPLSGREPSSPADYLIRANQGHTLAVDPTAMFTPVVPGGEGFPAKVLHGTYFAFWEAIVSSGGLRPMDRGYIHCAEEGGLSGMRADAELLVEIDVEASIREGGLVWWRSQNGVILTDGGDDRLLPSRFFTRVTGRSAGVGLLWEDGVKRADLPDGLRIKVPVGKRAHGSRRGGRGPAAPPSAGSN